MRIYTRDELSNLDYNIWKKMLDVHREDLDNYYRVSVASPTLERDIQETLKNISLLAELIRDYERIRKENSQIEFELIKVDGKELKKGDLIDSSADNCACEDDFKNQSDSKQIVIKLNNRSCKDNCGVCSQIFKPAHGPALFLEGTEHPVCDLCGEKNAPLLVNCLKAYYKK